MRRLMIIALLLGLVTRAEAQLVPSKGENIDFLSVFGSQADSRFGDDDHSQTLFFLTPKEFSDPFFIRVFDPGCGGKFDLAVDGFNTQTKFMVFNGPGTHSDEKARKNNPENGYLTGRKVQEKVYDAAPETDDNWVTLGPFNPLEGEFIAAFDGYVTKLVVEGTTGNDGNVYRVFLSTNARNNIPVEGGNVFTYEYTVRLKSKKNEVAHFYPYIDDKVISVKQSNFDMDHDGVIRLVSSARNGEQISLSGDNTWASSVHQVSEKEKNASIDVQIIKKGAWNNDMTFFITNQYDEALPFFSVPLGGVPTYNYQVKIKYGGK